MTSESVDFEPQTLENYWPDKKETEVGNLVYMPEHMKLGSGAIYRTVKSSVESGKSLEDAINEVISDERIYIGDEHIPIGEFDPREIYDGSVRRLLEEGLPEKDTVELMLDALKVNHVDSPFHRLEVAMCFARQGRIDLSELMTEPKDVIKDPTARNIARLAEALAYAAAGEMRTAHLKLQKFQGNIYSQKGQVEIIILNRVFGE